MSKKSQKQSLTVTRAELARLIGVTPDRITKYVAAGLPSKTVGGGRGKQSTFELAKVLPWLFNRRGAEIDEQRGRYYQLQGSRIEQDIRRRAGELVEASEVEQRWSNMVAAARERILALPAEAVQRGLIAPSAEDALIALVREALTELAARGGDAAAA